MAAVISINQITSVGEMYPSSGTSGVPTKATINANMLRQFVTDSRFGAILSPGGIPNSSLASIGTGIIANLAVNNDKIANATIQPGKLSTGAPLWDSSGRVVLGGSSSEFKDRLNIRGVLRLGGGTSEKYYTDSNSPVGVRVPASGPLIVLDLDGIENGRNKYKQINANRTLRYSGTRWEYTDGVISGNSRNAANSVVAYPWLATWTDSSFSQITEDNDSISNTYIAFDPAGSVSDWAYLRQIGTDNKFHLSLDMHDDNDNIDGQWFSIRNVQSGKALTDVVVNRFTIDGSGLVGINQATPTERLDVEGSIKAPTIYATNALQVRSNTTANIGLSSNGNAFISNSLRIGTSTAVPTNTKLLIGSGAIVPASGTTDATGIRFDGTDTNKTGYIRYDNSNRRLEIGVTNSVEEHLYLNPSGNVLLGTTTSSSKLSVGGTVTSNSLVLNGTDPNNTAIGSLLTLSKGSNTALLAGNVNIRVNGGRLEFYDNGTNTKGAYLSISGSANSIGSEIVTDANLSSKLRTNLVTIADAQTITGNKTFRAPTGTSTLVLAGDRTQRSYAQQFIFADSTAPAPAVAIQRYILGTKGTNINNNADFSLEYWSYDPITVKKALEVAPTALNSDRYSLKLKDGVIDIGQNDVVYVKNELAVGRSGSGGAIFGPQYMDLHVHPIVEADTHIEIGVGRTQGSVNASGNAYIDLISDWDQITDADAWVDVVIGGQVSTLIQQSFSNGRYKYVQFNPSNPNIFIKELTWTSTGGGRWEYTDTINTSLNQNIISMEVYPWNVTGWTGKVIRRSIYADYSLRFCKFRGVNSRGGIYKRGTGTLEIANEHAGDITLFTNNLSRLTITSTGSIDCKNNRIINTQAPVNDGDAANKAYVDSKGLLLDYGYASSVAEFYLQSLVSVPLPLLTIDKIIKDANSKIHLNAVLSVTQKYVMHFGFLRLIMMGEMTMTRVNNTRYKFTGFIPYYGDYNKSMPSVNDVFRPSNFTLYETILGENNSFRIVSVTILQATGELANVEIEITTPRNNSTTIPANTKMNCFIYKRINPISTGDNFGISQGMYTYYDGSDANNHLIQQNIQLSWEHGLSKGSRVIVVPSVVSVWGSGGTTSRRFYYNNREGSDMASHSTFTYMEIK